MARRFAEGDPDLEPAVLQQALELLMRWRLPDCHFFSPDSPERLMTLLDLSGSSANCDGAIHRLIWGYRGNTTRPLRVYLQALSLNPSRSHFHPPLAERWPDLVVFALQNREDWLTWVLSLGSCARHGLSLALKHEQSVVRLQAIAILGHLEEDFANYLRTLRELGKSDPDPEVRAAAQKLIKSQDEDR